MRKAISLLLMLAAGAAAAAEPVIDMHLHFYTAANYRPGAPQPPNGFVSPDSVEKHYRATRKAMQDNDIVLAVASAPLDWRNPDPEHLRKGVEVGQPDLDLAAVEAGMKSGEIRILGEFGNIYGGVPVTDPGFEPLFALAEKYDVPLAWHTGEGPPMMVYRGAPGFRLELGNPLALQDILVRHPKLRVYLMHAGGRIWQDEALAMMTEYPNLYADIGVVTWIAPYMTSSLDDFLLAARETGVLDRVMFGTDQMVWPQAIDFAIRAIREADYLTDAEKRAILHDNAARFLRLEDH